MDKLNSFFSLIDNNLGGSYWFVVALLLTGLFFSIYLGFPQIRFFRHSLRVLSGKYDTEHHKGDTSHFQSLTTALSGTIGTGNIAGVALAIHLGGPAALFWMMVTAFLGMTTKLVEVSLSHKYREVSDDGTISGGPMYYMKNRLNMKWLAVLFSVATILSSFGTGSLPQMNSISNAMFTTFDIPHWITGAVLAVVLGFIVIGGVKRIAKVSETLIPFMSVIFVLAAICVLIYNYENIIPSIKSIFTNIIDGTAATGGFLGAGFAWAFNRGVNRGLFSNEAGQGSAAIAHAAARTNEPVSEGIVALLEPFIDTIVICMLTGVVILSSGVWKEKFDNKFQAADMIVLAGNYSEVDNSQREQVSYYVNGKESSVEPFTGRLSVVNGKIESDVTIIHSRSFAENIVVSQSGEPYNGEINVNRGVVSDDNIRRDVVSINGASLVHSSPLSAQAFSRSVLGKYGSYVIPISLLLFAFSTAVAWYYYASRAVVYLWGTKYIVIYQIIYVIGFFVASFVDTTIVWTISGITVALMTLPNLFGILMLHKEVKNMVNGYWNKVKDKQ